MQIENLIKEKVIAAIQALFDAEASADTIIVSETKKEFDGDLTVVVFPFVRLAKKSPEATGTIIGEYLQEHLEGMASFNVIKGFLNLSFTDQFWHQEFKEISADEGFGVLPGSGERVVLEYIGPNTNKPLHFGHARNMMIGFATANILEANGCKVHKVNIYNDRGIAICRSMLAWQKLGNGDTPESTGTKGDHFVGKYYVEFSKLYQAQIEELVEGGMSKEDARKEAPIMLEAQEMLRKWEAGDEQVRALWKQMNDWVYQGFDETYAKLGVDYENAYKESDFYLSGKALVEEGVEQGVFYRKEDGSVWVDLTEEGLDHKLLLRADGTSVYLTQDIGVANQRYHDYEMKRSIYVVGNEQDYHFKVLKLVLAKLKKAYAGGIYHLSYGMVELPAGMGKMKTREGTTVDADDLIDEVVEKAAEASRNSGKFDELSKEEADQLFKTLGIGAIKFFLLKVNPQKRMIFNPADSIDLNGFTAPFIQYSYARICSILRKFGSEEIPAYSLDNMAEVEKELIQTIYKYPAVIKEAGDQLDPSVIANYVYNVAKTFNKFYAAQLIISENVNETHFRVNLSKTTARTIKQGLEILGIEAPERM